MENYFYTCQYCRKEYKPKRRKVQKYCCNSCRTRAFVLKNLKGLSLVKSDPKKPDQIKIDKMSLAGVGNSIAGNLIAKGIEQAAKTIFVKEEDKPATKKDVTNLLKALNDRYQPISNMPNRFDGAKPFYDYETQTIIYLKNPIQ